MWQKELGQIYSESWNNSVNTTPPTRGIMSPTVNPKLSMTNYKVGTPEINIAALSQAGDVPFGNPTEQEEVRSFPIDSQKVFDLIDELSSNLDINNNNDRNTLMVLSKLKSSLQ